MPSTQTIRPLLPAIRKTGSSNDLAAALSMVQDQIDRLGRSLEQVSLSTQPEAKAPVEMQAPALNDFSVALYGESPKLDSQTGQQYDVVRVTITEASTLATELHVWVYRGAAAPSIPTSWEYLSTIPMATPAFPVYADHKTIKEAAGYKLWYTYTPARSSDKTPPKTNAPAKSIDISATTAGAVAATGGTGIATVLDPGFEQWDKDNARFLRWTIYGTGGQSTSVKLADQASGFINNPVGGYSALSQVVPVVPGKEYFLRCAVRNEGPGTPRLKIDYLDKDRVWLGGANYVVGQYIPVSSGTWQLNSYTEVSTPPLPASCYFVEIFTVEAGVTACLAYVDQVEFTKKTESSTVGAGSVGVAAAAANIEFVALVNATPNADDELVISRVTQYVTNEYNGKNYVWSPSRSRYIRKASSGEFYADAITSPVIAAGAVGTRELSTVEILVGAGGGKPPRFKVQDAVGTMISFIGDDSAGFIGGYFQRLRVAPTFAGTQRIEASVSGVSIENVPLSIDTASMLIELNSTVGVKVKNKSDNSYTSIDPSGMVATNSALTSYTLAGYGGVAVYNGAVSLLTTMQGGGLVSSNYSLTNYIALGASDSVSAKPFIQSPTASAFVDFSGSNSYAHFYHYWFGDLYNTGTAFITSVTGNSSSAWIPATLSGGATLSDVISKINELLGDLGTAGLLTSISTTTCSDWWPVYNASGTYVGKSPFKT